MKSPLETTRRYRPRDHGLAENIGDRFLGGLVIHTGPSTFDLGNGVWAAPISSLWSESREPGSRITSRKPLRLSVVRGLRISPPDVALGDIECLGGVACQVGSEEGGRLRDSETDFIDVIQLHEEGIGRQV